MNNEEKEEEQKINSNNKGWRERNLWNKIKMTHNMKEQLQIA